MANRLENYILDNELVETSSSEGDKPIFRRPDFEGIVELAEIDRRVGEGLRNAREASDLTHADVAKLVGLHPIVYGRYERNETKMSVARLLHLSELLGASPIDLLMTAAPGRFGKSQAEADRRIRLIKSVERLSDEAVSAMLSFLDAITKCP